MSDISRLLYEKATAHSFKNDMSKGLINYLLEIKTGKSDRAYQ